MVKQDVNRDVKQYNIKNTNGKPGRHGKPIKPSKPSRQVRSSNKQSGGDDVPQPTYDYLLITKFSLSIFILMSYVLFGIATILFVFAVINILYLQRLYGEYETQQKAVNEVIDKPFFFQYLIKKDINLFLDIDGFILNYGGKTGAPSIVLWIIFSIIIINIIAFLFFKYNLNDSQSANYETFKNKLLPDAGYILIIVLPYLFLLIVAISHNVIQSGLRERCISNLDEIPGEEYDKSKLKEIKEKIKESIMKGGEIKYEKEIYDVYKVQEVPDVAPADASTEVPKKIKINIKNILDIYNPSSTNDEPNYKRKILGYIDRYFELLEYKNGGDDLYTYYYFMGLIGNINDSGYSTFSPNYTKLKVNIDDTRGKQNGYYWTVIVTYTVICCIGILYFFINNLYSGLSSSLVFWSAIRYRIAVLIAVIGMIFILSYSLIDRTTGLIVGGVTSVAITILAIGYSFKYLASALQGTKG